MTNTNKTTIGGSVGGNVSTVGGNVGGDFTGGSKTVQLQQDVRNELSPIAEAIEKAPLVNREQAKQELAKIEEEAAKADKADNLACQAGGWIGRPRALRSLCDCCSFWRTDPKRDRRSGHEVCPRKNQRHVPARSGIKTRGADRIEPGGAKLVDGLDHWRGCPSSPRSAPPASVQTSSFDRFSVSRPCSSESSSSPSRDIAQILQGQAIGRRREARRHRHPDVRLQPYRSVWAMICSASDR